MGGVGLVASVLIGRNIVWRPRDHRSSQLERQAPPVNDKAICIRELEAADLPQFQAWRAWDSYTEQVVAEHLSDHHEGGRIIFVAVDGGTIIGSAQLVLRQADQDLADGTTTGYLLALEVREEWRRRGVATALVRALEAEAARRGLRCLTLMVEPDNKPALSLYHKMGFSTFKIGTDSWRDRAYPVLCMVKALHYVASGNPSRDESF